MLGEGENVHYMEKFHALYNKSWVIYKYSSGINIQSFVIWQYLFIYLNCFAILFFISTIYSVAVLLILHLFVLIYVIFITYASWILKYWMHKCIRAIALIIIFDTQTNNTRKTILSNIRVFLCVRILWSSFHLSINPSYFISCSINSWKKTQFR